MAVAAALHNRTLEDVIEFVARMNVQGIERAAGTQFIDTEHERIGGDDGERIVAGQGVIGRIERSHILLSANDAGIFLAVREGELCENVQKFRHNATTSIDCHNGLFEKIYFPFLMQRMTFLASSTMTS